MSLTRSELMGRVRQQRTAPERLVARFLASHAIRFRYNVRGLPGTPDLANKTRRIAVFVHGCFWHRHEGCYRATTPKTNKAFWLAKFTANLERDRRRISQLKRMGYEVAVVWECQADDSAKLYRALHKVLPNTLRSQRSRPASRGNAIDAKTSRRSTR